MEEYQTTLMNKALYMMRYTDKHTFTISVFQQQFSKEVMDSMIEQKILWLHKPNSVMLSEQGRRLAEDMYA